MYLIRTINLLFLNGDKSNYGEYAKCNFMIATPDEIQVLHESMCLDSVRL